MMYNTSRNCTRCGKDLTDAASMEAGIGPICRNLDNELLARLIPSDLPGAKAAFDALDLTAVAPETLRTLNEVYGAIFSDDAATREDWRLEVKRIEWSLSFPANNYMRGDLTKVVSALGYVGLASLWDGDAATGKATCAFMDGRLVVQGPKNKAARLTFRDIPGRLFHKEGTLLPKASWSFPAEQYPAFFKAIITHYPNFTGLSESIEQAKAKTLVIDTETVPALPPLSQDASADMAALKEKIIGALGVPAAVLAPTPTPAPAPKAAPKCSITVAGLFVKVTSPYKPEYINELKGAFPYSDRRWNAHEKCWEVVAIHQAKVESIVKKHFGPAALGAVN